MGIDNLADEMLKMDGIIKRFPGVLALSDVSFDLKKGEVHVLIGENGAGKSTLMKILAGLYRKDGGIIKLHGKELDFSSPRDAIRNGVAMIHQELTPIPDLCVAENIFIGREPLHFGLIDKKKMIDQTRDLLSGLDSDIDPKLPMRKLSVAEMQMVEISKALSYNPQVIIMDEPTSALTEEEVDKLFSTIGKLKGRGTGIVYISHKLDEIFRIGDRITVLRDGVKVATQNINDMSRDELISLMVGREIKDVFPKRSVPIGDVVLSVEDLGIKNIFKDISFSVHAGEIFGIAGLMGAGRTEVVETIAGLRKPDTGMIRVNDKVIHISSPRDSIRNGISLVSEDRKRIGLNLKGSVKENMTILKLRNISRFGIIQNRKEFKIVDDQISILNIKTPDRNRKTMFLSGGNQQKVVIAKWLLNEPKILILDEPTRGIDVGAKSEIHKLIVDFAEKGMAVIMVSSELPEVMGMADRVLVMHEGEALGCLGREALSQESIMHLATGHIKGCVE
ncbi:sugar ABC transporter ATP-binding protein [Treponema sp.]